MNPKEIKEIGYEDINNKLEELYTKNWPNLSKELIEINESEATIKPTNPLLLTVKNEEKYLNADIRVMIFGQETNDWGGNFVNDIEYIQSIYDDFFSTRYCFKYGGQFWNGIKRFLKILEEKYPKKSIEFIWNNVVKIGKSGKKGKPPEHIYQAEKDNFRILEEELNILQPDMVLFLSGPYYDNILIKQFEGVEFKNIDKYNQRQIAEVNLKNVKSAYRTYHPNYLWRNGINDYYDAIIKEIKMNS